MTQDAINIVNDRIGVYERKLKNENPPEDDQYAMRFAIVALEYVKAQLEKHNTPAAPDAEALEALELAEKWLCNCMPIGNIEGPKPLPVIRKAIAALQSQAPSVDDAALDELLTKEDVRELEINGLPDGTYKAWIYPRPMDLEKVRRGIDKTPLSALKRALSGTAKKVGE